MSQSVSVVSLGIASLALMVSTLSVWFAVLQSRRGREVELARGLKETVREMLEFEHIMGLCCQQYRRIAEKTGVPGEETYEFCRRMYRRCEALQQKTRNCRETLDGINKDDGLLTSHRNRVLIEEMKGRYEVQVDEANRLLEDCKTMHEDELEIQELKNEARVLMAHLSDLETHKSGLGAHGG